MLERLQLIPQKASGRMVADYGCFHLLERILESMTDGLKPCVYVPHGGGVPSLSLFYSAETILQGGYATIQALFESDDRPFQALGCDREPQQIDGGGTRSLASLLSYTLYFLM